MSSKHRSIIKTLLTIIPIAIRLKMQFTQVYTNRARATQRLAQSKATEGYTEEARNLYKAAIADRTSAIQF